MPSRIHTGKDKINVFISYRRQGGREFARNLNDRLTMKGYSVFFDYESLRDGKFNVQIFSAIERARDFVFVLSKDALEKCVNDDDWVRKELTYAIQLNKHIILVCPEDVFDGFPKTLPKELEGLKSLQILFLNPHYYEESIQKFYHALQSSPHPLRIIALGFCFIILILLLWLFFRPWSVDSNASEIIANCYLTNYAVLEENGILRLSDEQFELFHYVDTLDEGRYFIYPISCNYALRKGIMLSPLKSNHIPVHTPVLTLRLKNRGKGTVIINNSFVRIRNVRSAFEKPVFVSYSNDFAFHNLAPGKVSLECRVADYAKQRILSTISEEFQSSDGSISFANAGNLNKEQRIIGSLKSGNESISFIFKGQERVLEPYYPDEYDLPFVNINTEDIVKEIPFSNFPHRKLSQGESDAQYMFFIQANASCCFEMKVCLSTTDRTEIETEWFTVFFYHAENWP